MNILDSIEWIFFWMNIRDFVLNWIIFRPDSMKKWIFKTDRPGLLQHHQHYTFFFPPSSVRHRVGDTLKNDVLTNCAELLSIRVKTWFPSGGPVTCNFALLCIGLTRWVSSSDLQKYLPDQNETCWQWCDQLVAIRKHLKIHNVIMSLQASFLTMAPSLPVSSEYDFRLKPSLLKHFLCQALAHEPLYDIHYTISKM